MVAVDLDVKDEDRQEDVDLEADEDSKVAVRSDAEECNCVRNEVLHLIMADVEATRAHTRVDPKNSRDTIVQAVIKDNATKEEIKMAIIWTVTKGLIIQELAMSRFVTRDGTIGAKLGRKPATDTT